MFAGKQSVKQFPSNKSNGGGKAASDLSFTFMLHIFYVSRSVVAFGRVFEFFVSLSFFCDLHFGRKEFFSFSVSEFIIICFNCEHEPVFVGCEVGKIREWRVS